MRYRLQKDIVALPEEKLCDWLLNNLPVKQIASIAAELIKAEDKFNNKQPIVVDRDEFDRIFSLFKIRGMRSVDGELVAETRGRRRLDSK